MTLSAPVIIAILFIVLLAIIGRLSVRLNKTVLKLRNYKEDLKREQRYSEGYERKYGEACQKLNFIRDETGIYTESIHPPFRIAKGKTAAQRKKEEQDRIEAARRVSMEKYTKKKR